MKVVKEALAKVPEVEDKLQGVVDPVLAVEKQKSEENQEKYDEVVKDATEFDRKKPFLGAEKQEVPEEAEQELKKISLEESLFDEIAELSDEDILVVEEPANEVEVEEEPIEDVSNDSILALAGNVMAAYQNANKWLDSIKEVVYSELSCVFFSSFIHTLAHTMPGRFDKFGDILHTANLEIPYPATAEIAQKPTDITEVFAKIFEILNGIKESLNAFISGADTEYHGMACAAEALLNDIEEEYPMLFRMQKQWDSCNGDMATFDKYVGQYTEHKDDLLESLNEGVRDTTDKLLAAVEDGMLDANTALLAALKYMSEDEVAEMCRMNEFDFCDEVEESLDTNVVEEDYDDVETFCLRDSQNGNAYWILGYTANAMKECGTKEEIANMREAATASDYDNLCKVCNEYLAKCNEYMETVDDDYQVEGLEFVTDGLDITNESADVKALEDAYLGKTIRINFMINPGSNIDDSRYNGKEGEVTDIDDMGQLHGTWGGLAVIPEVDDFEVIE